MGVVTVVFVQSLCRNVIGETFAERVVPLNMKALLHLACQSEFEPVPRGVRTVADNIQIGYLRIEPEERNRQTGRSDQSAANTGVQRCGVEEVCESCGLTGRDQIILRGRYQCE